MANIVEAGRQVFGSPDETALGVIKGVFNNRRQAVAPQAVFVATSCIAIGTTAWTSAPVEGVTPQLEEQEPEMLAKGDLDLTLSNKEANPPKGGVLPGGVLPGSEPPRGEPIPPDKRSGGYGQWPQGSSQISGGEGQISGNEGDDLFYSGKVPISENPKSASVVPPRSGEPTPIPVPTLEPLQGAIGGLYPEQVLRWFDDNRQEIAQFEARLGHNDGTQIPTIIIFDPENPDEDSSITAGVIEYGVLIVQGGNTQEVDRVTLPPVNQQESARQGRLVFEPFRSGSRENNFIITTSAGGQLPPLTADQSRWFAFKEGTIVIMQTDLTSREAKAVARIDPQTLQWQLISDSELQPHAASLEWEGEEIPIQLEIDGQTINSQIRFGIGENTGLGDGARLEIATRENLTDIHTFFLTNTDQNRGAWSEEDKRALAAFLQRFNDEQIAIRAWSEFMSLVMPSLWEVAGSQWQEQNPGLTQADFFAHGLQILAVNSNSSEPPPELDRSVGFVATVTYNGLRFIMHIGFREGRLALTLPASPEALAMDTGHVIPEIREWAQSMELCKLLWLATRGMNRSMINNESIRCEVDTPPDRANPRCTENSAVPMHLLNPIVPLADGSVRPIPLIVVITSN